MSFMSIPTYHHHHTETQSRISSLFLISTILPIDSGVLTRRATRTKYEESPNIQRSAEARKTTILIKHIKESTIEKTVPKLAKQSALIFLPDFLMTVHLQYSTHDTVAIAHPITNIPLLLKSSSFTGR